MFGVPVTIERPYYPEDEAQNNGTEVTGYFSFYDEYPEEMIPTASTQSEYFSIDDLLEADRVNGDCSQTNKTCSHIYPEGTLHILYSHIPFIFFLEMQSNRPHCQTYSLGCPCQH